MDAAIDSFLQKFHTGSGAHPASYSMELLWKKKPMCTAKNSPVYKAEFKNKRSYNSAPPDAFVVCAGENFTFPLYLLPLSKASYDFSRIWACISLDPLVVQGLRLFLYEGLYT